MTDLPPMPLADWLNDLCVRFLINLPTEELATSERLCFQIEEAQWFYEDFIRPSDPELPSLNLRNFTMLMFTECPLTSHWSQKEQEVAFEAFLAYKTSVPVRGAILLNQSMDEVVLVKGWKKGASWSFPRGKIDIEESDLNCAVREVYEETGYDLKGTGLLGEEENMKSIEVRIRGQELKMYVFRGVPKDTHFEPRTRKEISKIEWYKLSDLPTGKTKRQQQQGHGTELVNANKYYMVAPFLGPLKKWIAQQKKRDRAVQANHSEAIPQATLTVVEDDALDQEAIEDEIKDERAEEAHLRRLLHTLRESSKAKTSDLPEVTNPWVDVRKDERDGVAQPVDMLSLMTPQMTTGEETLQPLREKPKGYDGSAMSADLSAYIGIGRPQAPPQAQYLDDQGFNGPIQSTPSFRDVARQTSTLIQPPSSSSPNQHPLPPKPPPTARLPPNDRTLAPSIPIQLPQMRSIPPPSQPAQLAPRTASVYPGAPLSSNIASPSIHSVNPNSRDDLYSSQSERRTAPLASDLPPPNLNPEKSKLLDLFRGNPSAKSLESNGLPQKIHQPDLADSKAQASALLKLIKNEPPAPAESPDGATQEPVLSFPQGSQQYVSKAASAFVPPQVSRRSSEKVTRSDKPKIANQKALLDIFRAPSIPNNISNALQPPVAAIELSASPSPGHSRKSPHTGRKQTGSDHKMPSQSVTLQRRPAQADAPVSATVKGPLDIPQFDMIRSSTGETQTSAPTSPKQVLPIQILARPSAPQKPSCKYPQSSITVDQPPYRQVDPQVTEHLLSTSTKIPQPLTPDLKARKAPSKPFQPQILRRPGTSQGTAEPSPISPLPSPRQQILPAHNLSQATEHKKSLLSLFTKPSPAISPSTASPSNPVDLNTLVSPLEKPPTAPIQHFERLPTDVYAPLVHTNSTAHPPPAPPKQQNKFYAPDRMPPPPQQPPVTSRIGVGVSRPSSPKHKPTPTPKHSSTTLPDQKRDFLLGFLDQQIKSGR